MHAHFDQIVKNKDIYIYGVGNNGRKFASILKDEGYNITSFIDRSAKENQIYCGITCKTPFTLSNEDAQTSVVIISIFNRDADLEKIIDFCKNECGFIHVLTVFDMIDYFFDKTGNFFWLSNQSNNIISNRNIEDCLRLFADETSRTTFKQTIEARAKRDFSLLPDALSLTDQYFSADIPLHVCKTFVDVGAYDGDSIDGLTKRFGQIENYIAFEPDQENFNKLSDKVKNAPFYGNAFLYPCGLWNKNEMLTMNSGAGEASAISSSGSTSISVVALDSIIIGLPPDYIKMDIEGAEIEALQGAKNLIQRYKPDLAISVYHKPEHVYQIQQLIHSWNLDYSFYLRQYGHCGFDLVLYAINKKK